MPSGSKVQANVYSWGLNIYIYIMGNMKGRTVGLCGTFDDNRDNDLNIKDTGEIVPPVNGMAPDQVTDSWR
jgi:hypothetical protein